MFSYLQELHIDWRSPYSVLGPVSQYAVGLPFPLMYYLAALFKYLKVHMKGSCCLSKKTLLITWLKRFISVQDFLLLLIYITT